MAVSTITDVDTVRSEGALKAPSESAGSASGRQIERAIVDAWRTMNEKLGATLYSQVQAYTDTDLETQANADQYDAFLHAESCYTIAQLFKRCSIEQLSATGLIQSREIGKARESFASNEEVGKLAAGWEHRANRWLAPYLAVPVDSITNRPKKF